MLPKHSYEIAPITEQFKTLTIDALNIHSYKAQIWFGFLGFFLLVGNGDVNNRLILHKSVGHAIYNWCSQVSMNFHTAEFTKLAFYI